MYSTSMILIRSFNNIFIISSMEEKFVLEDLARQTRYLKIVLPFFGLKNFLEKQFDFIYQTEMYDADLCNLNLLVDLFERKLVGWPKQMPFSLTFADGAGTSFHLLNEQKELVCSLFGKIPYRLVPPYSAADKEMIVITVDEEGYLPAWEKTVNLADFVEAGVAPEIDEDRGQMALDQLLSMNLSADELRTVLNGIMRQLAIVSL